MLLDLGPLRSNTAFRRLFASQFIAGLGTMVSYVAVPWQLYELTRSNAQVGLLGLVQLLPVVLCGLLGGAVADRMDRKRPRIGNARAGFLADAWGVSAAIWTGGAICLAGVIATGFALPRFWAYRSRMAAA